MLFRSDKHSKYARAVGRWLLLYCLNGMNTIDMAKLVWTEKAAVSQKFPQFVFIRSKIDRANKPIGKQLDETSVPIIPQLRHIRKLNGYINSYPESVENWIKRIAGAKLVLTDSFHGTVISLLYHRQFVVYVANPNRITRIVSLLTQLGLSERILTSKNKIEEFFQVACKQIDWVTIDEKLSRLRSDSLNLLKDALR